MTASDGQLAGGLSAVGGQMLESRGVRNNFETDITLTGEALCDKIMSTVSAASGLARAENPRDFLKTGDFGRFQEIRPLF